MAMGEAMIYTKIRRAKKDPSVILLSVNHNLYELTEIEVKNLFDQLKVILKTSSIQTPIEWDDELW